ncbi:hypothetical protein FRC03_008616 [Tulasnella sp. 419]|nr:hypothetical protein FRC02_009983 [Tulasnella sp. 418]KAG8970419.1 hypothetical protein FRC03_008616 [Tulasnella sp. 419]
MPGNRKLGCIDLPEVTPPSTPQRFVSRSGAHSPYHRSNSMASSGGAVNTPSRSNSSDYHPQLPSNLLLNFSSLKISQICLNDSDATDSPPPSAISLGSETTSNNGDKPVSPFTPDDRTSSPRKSDHLTMSPNMLANVYATPNTMRIQSCPWPKEAEGGSYSSSAAAEDESYDDDAWWELNQSFDTAKPSDFVRKE